MNAALSLILYLSVLMAANSRADDSSDETSLTLHSEELCIQDVFKPKCSHSDMVLIKSAKYGRMKIGKCLSEKEVEAFGSVSKDTRNVGCYDDITEILNSRCNFRSGCEIKINDFQIDHRLLGSKACFPGLIKYLETEYNCLSVQENMEDCRIQVRSKPTHINPSVVPDSCKSMGNSLKIEAPKGQRIEIRIVNLNQSHQGIETKWPHGCGYVVAELSDATGKTNATVCQNGFLVLSNVKLSNRDFKNEFLSKGHFLDVRFPPLEQTGTYLLRLQAEGCLDIIPPEDTWLKRNNDDIVIGCYSSKHTWYLRCENGKWTGTIGNCSNQHVFSDKSKIVEKEVLTQTGGKMLISESSQVLIIVAISGFGVVVCVTIICAGVVCLKRYKTKEAHFDQNYSNFKPNQMRYSSYSSHPNSDSTVKTMHRFNTVNGMMNGQPFVRENAAEQEERYQVLDAEEVAKETTLLA